MIRKQILSLTTIAAFAAILLAWAPSTAYAGVNNGATVGMAENGCGVPTLDGFVIADAHWVVTNSHNGNTKLTCQQENVVNTQGRGYQLDFDDISSNCNTAGGSTPLFKIIVSDNGDGTGDLTLQCWVR